MKVQQLYTNCLAQGAYYIAHKGEAAIIDPLRETQPYLDLIKADGVKLKYIFETHFHADFVSGHVDLAKATGATIVYGPNAQTGYNTYVAKDGEVFTVGGLSIEVLHTPGHTLESSTFLLKDEQGEPHSIFTGDTLFIGDVGRPDLAIKSDLTQENLAGMLYDSLQHKIMPLPDHVLVYPAHGAGSACGKNMSKETFDTLGNQKKVNYALNAVSKEWFIKELTTGILPPPQYFAKNAMLNKNGYEAIEAVMQKGGTPLTVSEVETLLTDKSTLVLDVRNAQSFGAAHLPGSLFIGLDGQFAPWVGAVIEDLNTPIVLVVPEGREAEAVMRLSRVGYDNCIGYLQGGVEAWQHAGKAVEGITSVPAERFAELYKEGVCVLDVRKPGEYATAHLEQAESQPLDLILQWSDDLDKHTPYYVHCAGGYRSMIAASFLKRKGYASLTDVAGGFSAIQKSSLFEGVLK
jgi:hydroxyacylglutathione hydrolase